MDIGKTSVHVARSLGFFDLHHVDMEVGNEKEKVD